MGLYPGARRMLIPESGTQPRIRPTIVIVHTHVGNPTLEGARNQLLGQDGEHHFNLRIGGTELAQYVDTEVRADNNFRANSFPGPDGVLCGAISIETGDRHHDGDPGLTRSFSDLHELDALADLIAWCCRTHGIPAQQCASPTGPGIGYHSMWGFNTRAPGPGTFGRYNVPAKHGGGTARLNNPWTDALGKTCPGAGKIAEFGRLVDAVRERLAGDHGRIAGSDGATDPVPADFGGVATITDRQASTWAIGQGAPADIIADVVPLYWELAPLLGLRPEVPFAQALIETANFRFPRCGQTVCPDYHNPCGMRTRHLVPADGETPENHQRFATWREGIHAHLDHLALYLGLPGYPKAETPDPRHFPTLLGKVGSLTDLGRWWVKGGAGPHPDYGRHIGERVVRMRGAAADETPPIDATAPTGTTTVTTTQEEDIDMATIADLETAVSNVLSTAVGQGTTSFGETVRTILTVTQDNHNSLQQVTHAVAGLGPVDVTVVETGVGNVLSTAIGEGTTSYGETVQAILAVVRDSFNQLVVVNERVAAIEARLNGS